MLNKMEKMSSFFSLGSSYFSFFCFLVLIFVIATENFYWRFREQRKNKIESKEIFFPGYYLLLCYQIVSIFYFSNFFFFFHFFVRCFSLRFWYDKMSPHYQWDRKLYLGVVRKRLLFSIGFGIRIEMGKKEKK